MKLTSVEIHAENSTDVVVLSFRDPASINKYNVKSILGLDADQIVPKYYGASSNSKFYQLSLERRDIVIKVGLNPIFEAGFSYSDLRDALYKMIASSRSGKVQIQFKNNTSAKAAISGFISKIEAPNFEKIQEVNITVNCDDPMLKSLSPVSVDISDLTPGNTIISDDESTSPHGFAFALKVNGPIPYILITDPDDLSWSFKIAPVGGFLANDLLAFSSDYNNKYLYLIRDGDILSLGDAIVPGSVWPIIFPGDNRFSLKNWAPDDNIWAYLSGSSFKVLDTDAYDYLLPGTNLEWLDSGGSKSGRISTRTKPLGSIVQHPTPTLSTVNTTNLLSPAYSTRPTPGNTDIIIVRGYTSITPPAGYLVDANDASGPYARAIFRRIVQTGDLGGPVNIVQGASSSIVIDRFELLGTAEIDNGGTAISTKFYNSTPVGDRIANPITTLKKSALIVIDNETGGDGLLSGWNLNLVPISDHLMPSGGGATSLTVAYKNGVPPGVLTPQCVSNIWVTTYGMIAVAYSFSDYSTIVTLSAGSDPVANSLITDAFYSYPTDLEWDSISYYQTYWGV